MAWTGDEKAAIIKAFSEKGESASVIARRHGTTRNAILGVVHRHRLKSGLAPRPPKVAAAATARRKQTLRPADRRGGIMAAQRFGKSAALVADHSGIFADHVVMVPPIARAVPIADLSDGECRFAVTPHHARPTEHRFCGAPADGSFCAHHARIVFNQA